MSLTGINDLRAGVPLRGRPSPPQALVAGAGLLLLAALVQTSVFAYLPGAVPRPDLVLVLALAWAYARGSGEGFLAAVVGGALLDLTSSAPFGLHVLTAGAAISIVGREGGPFATSTPRRMLGTILGGALAHGLAMAALSLRGWEAWSVAVWAHGIGPTLATDALLLPVAYLLVKRLPEPRPDTGMRGV